MTPEEAAASFHASVLELGNVLVALAGVCAVMLAIIAGVQIVRAVWR